MGGSYPGAGGRRAPPRSAEALLDAAGVGPGKDLIASVEVPGRIVLEDAATVLGRLQDAVAAGVHDHRDTGGATGAGLDGSTADSAR